MRERLSNRRVSTSFTFECGGLRYHATVSCFDDGRIGEVFITNTKPSSQSDVNARDAGVAASLAFSSAVRSMFCAKHCSATARVIRHHHWERRSTC